MKAASRIDQLAPKQGFKPKGYTLVELAVYLAFSSLIILAAIQVLSSTQDSSERGTQVSDARQNVRGSMAMITRELRGAGSGFGNVPVTASHNDEPLTLHAVQPVADAPGFTITGAMEPVSSIVKNAVENHTTPVECSSVLGFAIGDLVVITDHRTAHMFQVTEIDYDREELKHDSSSPYNPINPYADWPANGYPKNSDVYKVNIVSYYLDEVAETLMRSEPGEEPMFVAGGITELTVNYRLADGTTTQTPSDSSEVRAVILSMRSTSDAVREGDCASQLLTTTVAPRCVIR